VAGNEGELVMLEGHLGNVATEEWEGSCEQDSEGHEGRCGESLHCV